MMSLNTPASAQKLLSEYLQKKRLELGFTQFGLSRCSGVPLSTLRKFEQKSVISLESFLKLLMSLGCLDDFIKVTFLAPQEFKSIYEVERLNSPPPLRKRGWKK